MSSAEELYDVDACNERAEGNSIFDAATEGLRGSRQTPMECEDGRKV